MEAKKNTFTLIELIAVVVVVGTLAAVILPSLGHRNEGVNDHMRCRSNLKNIGTTAAIYFIDGSQTHFPLVKDSFIKAGDMDVDQGIIICPTEDKNTYIWLTGPVENTWSATKALAADSVAHKKEPQFYAVYEDGHVALAPKIEL
jgi:type II secretory pathway pseudopilin PulG